MILCIIKEACEWQWRKKCSSGWFRSIDLWVMGPARFHCATLLPWYPKESSRCWCPKRKKIHKTEVRTLSLEAKKKKEAPNKGLEPLTLRLKVWCSTDWANRALGTKWRRCASDQETKGAKHENDAASRIRTCEGNSHWISSPTP